MFSISFEPALRAGAIGGAVVFILMITARIMHLSTLNPTLLLGWTITRRHDEGTDMLGFLLHLGLSCIGALVYAMAFTVLPVTGWIRGCIVSLPHLALSALLIAGVLRLFPDIRNQLSSSRVHHVAYDIIIFVMLHLVYGIAVGFLYTA